MSHQPERILFFDGVCNLCNTSVNFVVRNDPRGYIKMAPLQGKTAQRLLDEQDLPAGDPESLLFWDQGKVYRYSGAALRVARYLRFPWTVFLLFLLVPPVIRNRVYRFVAANRYKWFGKKDSCRLPEPHELARFLD